ncbi:hypothetical protein BDW75DRAFT_162071 [Aspergillus navahoensis]
MNSLARLSFNLLEDAEAEQRSLQIDRYRERIVQCLIVGQYTKAGPYVLETVINYVYVEFGTNPNVEKDIWFLLSNRSGGSSPGNGLRENLEKYLLRWTCLSVGEARLSPE